MALFEELKRRNVFRVGIAYAIVAWLLLQVVDLVLENIDAPDWVMQVFMLAVAIGLPLVLFFAWAFELTPEGLKRERDVDRSQSITPQTGRKLDRAIIAVLALALGYFMFDKFAHREPTAQAPAAAEGTAAPVADQRSIAVLPFVNRSSHEEDAFFAEGIHDDLLTSLAKVGALKVISRTSVMRYRDSQKSIPEIAGELGVATVLEGGIQRSANQVRINVQLIDAETDEHLWAENYDRELTAQNLFAIQSEISREIVHALSAALSDEESQQLAAVPTTSLEAYGEYVLGRQEMARRTAESLLRARQHFEKAIAFDARYAQAYVGLADALDLLTNYGDLNIVESYAPRQAAIDTALKLAPRSGEAYTSLANLRLSQVEREEAEQHFLKGIELSPNYATAYHWYSILLGFMDRHEEALMQARRALELDPLAPILTVNLASILADLGRVEESNALLLEGTRREPEFPSNYLLLAENLVTMGRIGEALTWSQAAKRLADTSSNAFLMECWIWLQLGDIEQTETCLSAAEEAFPETAFGARSLTHQYRHQWAESVALLEQVLERNPLPGWRRGLAWNYLTLGETAGARALLMELNPELLGTEPVQVSRDDLWPTAQVAYLLYLEGNTQRADALFDQVLAIIPSKHRLRGDGYGVLDVFIHAVRDEREQAIAALRNAIDTGWREDWWRLRGPLYATLREEPAWTDLMVELEADIARQRQWYENHKDDPLF